MDSDSDQEQERYRPKRETFGRWLLAQKDRGDWVDDLAAAARADRSFPKGGDPEAVRKHLRSQQADGDVFQAIDDAESDWQSIVDTRPVFRDFIDGGDESG
ncbi:MAG: hypothetical protein V4564_23385 [Pseudomonadota bacterium]|uniref:hypothetical protein n=1 Tax=Sphingomonas sp. ERG5 TaxID=1381597 RepID=UPI00068C9B5B|nr:hypothetical protein [Sphingomonas sp. ERG5]